MGGKKKYIEMFGSFTKPLNCTNRSSWNADATAVFCCSSGHMLNESARSITDCCWVTDAGMWQAGDWRTADLVHC